MMDYSQRQALPLIELTAEDSGLSCSDARDGYHFIALTALERSTLPDVVSMKRSDKLAKISETKTDDIHQIIDSQVIELISDTPESLFPTTKWKRIQSEKFKRLQSKVGGLRENVNKFNNDDAIDNSPATLQEDLWLNYCKTNEPLLGRVLKVGQRNLETLLEFQSNWLLDDLDWYMENRNWAFPWIYASLVCLSIPLEADVMNSMRKITKTCYILRSQMKSEHVNLATPLNLIIRIVSINFRQHDLGDIPFRTC